MSAPGRSQALAPEPFKGEGSRVSATTESTLHFVDPRQFKARTAEAVDDAHLRASFRSAMDFLQSKRASHFGDVDEFETLRDVGRAKRASAAPS